jgi:hypothetical protein
LRPRSPDPPGSFLRAGLHLAGLSTFAFAQPLFDLLGRNVEFFAVRGSTRWDVLVFALGLVIVPPLALLAVVAVAGRAATAVHLALVALLSGLVTLQAIRDIDAPDALLVAGAGLIGAGAGWAYARLGPVRLGATALSPATLAFLAFFLLFSPASRLVLGAAPEPRLGRAASDTPVVLVVFDELPTISLLNEKGEIDRTRYPAFARLADDATWFRNATTVEVWTTWAVPAILTGRLPGKRDLPLYLDHPDNLFTLLGGSHELHVSESVTYLCPRELCPERGDSFRGRLPGIVSDAAVVYPHLLLPDGLRARLAPLADAWTGFRRKEGRPEAHAGRAEQVRRFASSIERSGRPGLFFLHVLLPHHPWEFLPDGRRYENQFPAQPGVVDGRWVADPDLAVQGWQRHLLQVAYTDRVLGSILDGLRTEGLYEEALVIVTADHGVSFRPRAERRRAEAGNLQEIAFVPLLVKGPGQAERRVVNAHVRTVDVLPTIAEVVGADATWHLDGRSLLRSRPGAEPQVAVYSAADEAVTADPRELAARRDRTLARQVELFRSGLYGIGPRPDLLGRVVDGLAAVADEARVRLYADGFYDPAARVVPTSIAGGLSGVTAGGDVAIAVNGRIWAVAPSFEQGGNTRFSALLPPTAFRPGDNDIRVFLVSGDRLVEALPIGD